MFLSSVFFYNFYIEILSKHPKFPFIEDFQNLVVGGVSKLNEMCYGRKTCTSSEKLSKWVHSKK